MPVRAALAQLWERCGCPNPDDMLDWPSDLPFQFIWYLNAIKAFHAEDSDE